MQTKPRIEWPTLALLSLCYGLWLAGITAIAAVNLAGAAALVTLTLVLHSSLQHEALHGHPFRSKMLNEALVFPALGLIIPYIRFRDTHLAHHRNALLTDPYDDPESNYFDPKVWNALPLWKRRVLAFNNTLLGRMLAGPLIGTGGFILEDVRLIRNGDRGVLKAWIIHGIAAAPVIAVVALSAMPLWAYFICAYAALSILRIRTFLEHRAHASPMQRSVIIDDKGPLALIFLNNNLHAVHHAHPGVSWYKLPALYQRRRSFFLRYNGGYYYPSYPAIFKSHLLNAKDPVSHPLMPE